jgi:hypothetical protein
MSEFPSKLLIVPESLVKTADDERLLVKLIGSNTGWNDDPVKVESGFSTE